MVKGVNRNIIEIAETENEVFERAILFVRPESRDQDPSALESKAQRYLNALRPRRLHRWRMRSAVLLRYAAAAGAGAMAAYFLMQL